MAEKDLSKIRKQLKETYKREKEKDREYRKRLVEEVSRHPCIWNPRTPLHRDRLRVDAAWQKVVSAIGKPKETVKKSWKALKDHFRVLYLEVTIGKHSGNGAVQERMDAVKWPFFKSLLFLKDNCVIGDNVPDSDVDNNTTMIDATDFDVDLNRTTSNVPDCDLDLNDSPEDEQGPATEYSDGDGDVHNNSERDFVDYDDDSPTLNTRETTSPVTVSRGRSKNRHHSSHNILGMKRRFENDETKWQESMGAVDHELRSLPTPDAVTRFCDYLGDILREIPPEKRRSCFHSIINFANSCADGLNPVILSSHALLNDSVLQQ